MLSLLISRVVFRRTKSLWNSYFTETVDARAKAWSEHVWENTKNCALATFQVDKSFIPSAASRDVVSAKRKDEDESDDLFEGIDSVNLTPSSVVLAEWAVYEPALDAFRMIFEADSPVGMGRRLLLFVQMLHNCNQPHSGVEQADKLKMESRQSR